jgi:DNA-directed RNA polymerase sigma subunit (sigma70/sigma32)
MYKRKPRLVSGRIVDPERRFLELIGALKDGHNLTIEQMRDVISVFLSEFNDREIYITKLRHGLHDGWVYTYDAIAKAISRSRTTAFLCEKRVVRRLARKVKAEREFQGSRKALAPA